MQHSLLPKFLQVELTYACNSACSFCYNPNHKRAIDLPRLRAILSAVNQYEIKHVQLIGGEVTLIPELPSFLDLLRNCEWRSLVTNGRIFVPELNGRVNEIYLSLHGDEAVHEKLTNAKGSFSVIETSIRKYVSFGIDVHSDTVLTSQNFSQIYEIGRHASELGMKILYLNIFQPAGIGAHFTKHLAPSVDQIREAITQMIAVRDELGMRVQFGTSTPFCLDERLLTHGLAYTCGTGTWFGSIDPDGNFRICNQSTRPYGNILEQPLNRIWHSPEIDRSYRNLDWIAEPCSTCPMKSDCLGGCRIDGAGKPRIDPLMEGRDAPLISESRLRELAETHKRQMFFG